MIGVESVEKEVRIDEIGGMHATSNQIHTRNHELERSNKINDESSATDEGVTSLMMWDQRPRKVVDGIVQKWRMEKKDDVEVIHWKG